MSFDFHGGAVDPFGAALPMTVRSYLSDYHAFATEKERLQRERTLISREFRAVCHDETTGVCTSRR